VKKQLTALDEAEQSSNVKRTNKDVRKRLQAAREQRDHVEQAKGTRSQFEKDMAGLLHNYQCQMSQIVAKEPLKQFLMEIEKDLDGVIAKILRLMWGDSDTSAAGEYNHLRSGLSRAKFAELVLDQAFSKYFKWQADQVRVPPVIAFLNAVRPVSSSSWSPALMSTPTLATYQP
jgi:hypothetical protein